ncbi:DUF4349 domain-containing protein [Paenibacillus validus]|uniref:DUF4349 domain-containing protein n=3 Tax=Paenibacillus validus TaxID=44253 RepID=UPI000FDA834D|nr:DUF4349 domain-containing protein [Paenibacillus validus]
MKEERSRSGNGFRVAINRRGARLLLASALIASALAGCSSASSDKSASEAAKSGAPTANSAQHESVSAGAADQAGGEAQNAAAASSQNAPPQGGSFTGQTAAEGDDAYSRKIIYHANLSMQVENYADTETRVQEAVKRSGGYVLQFNESTSASEKSGTFVIKVPANGFQSLLVELEKINPSMRKSMEGQDVTEEYVDLSSRLKAKQLVESRLISFMEKATKADELVAFSSELGKVQEEIERIKGRMRYLEQNVSYSTIDLRIAQKIGSAEAIGAQERGPLAKRASAALQGSLTVLNVVLQGIVVVLAGALPILVLLVIVAIPLWWVRRRRKAKLASVRQRLAEENKTE